MGQLGQTNSRRTEQGESLEELEGDEREHGAATRCRMGKTIDDAFASGRTVGGSLHPLRYNTRSNISRGSSMSRKGSSSLPGEKGTG